MATIRRRSHNRQQQQCRNTRRVVTIPLLILVVVVALRISWTTLFPRGNNKAPRGNNPQELNVDEKDVVVLTLQVNNETRVDISMKLFAQEAPKAANYVTELATNTQETCQKCTIYRGEPVPSYWGSPDYPDRYFDGGRWGPPYALVQGGLVSDSSEKVPPAESYNPIIERGMVAWAGGKGGPHFFIALAQHPEWKHDHTVFGQVLQNDMTKVDALLSLPLVSTKPKQPPIVSNFVTPIPFTIRMKVSMNA